MATKNVMQDGSVSWTQPPSRGLWGWEGKCGPTAAANVLTTLLRRDVSPENVDGRAGDVMPGASPGTVTRAMNAVTQGARMPARFSAGIGVDLRQARPSNPIPCLLRWGESTLHYVTVVRCAGGRVTYNTYGEQRTESAATFDRKWALRGSVVVAAMSHASGLLPRTCIVRN